MLGAASAASAPITSAKRRIGANVHHGPLARHRRLVPLVLATTRTQASIVVLAPLIVAIGDDLGASVSAVGHARAILAGVAVTVSLWSAR